MASVFRPKGRDKYRIKYRTPDGSYRVVVGFTDRAATLAKATELERRAEREAAGLTSPADDAARLPLEDHVVAFEAALRGRGNTPEHVARHVSRVRRLLLGCKRVGDMTPSRVQGVLAEMRAKGAGATTLNNHLVAAKGFAIWLVRNRLAPDDPLAGLSRFNVAADRRHVRRALDADELSDLITAARQSTETIHGLDGPARAALYATAAFTGLRAGELRSLTAASFALDADPPTVTVKAMYSKHRREDRLPLHPDLVATLRAFLPTRSPFGAVWPGAWRPLACPMLRSDLAEAGIPVEVNGRVADFHGLRVSFITALSRAGVHPRTAMELARHGSIGLTMSVYTKLELHDTAAAVAMLPNLSPDSRADVVTGTEGDSERYHRRYQKGDSTGHPVVRRDTARCGKTNIGIARSANDCAGLRASDSARGEATRGGLEPPMREPKSLVLPITPPGIGPHSTK